jgi:CTP-dependent riboflavin kinase
MLIPIEINGTKRSGLNAASNTIPLQFGYFVSEFKDISNCFKGTINIQLDQDLIILNPDYRTKPIRWSNEMPEEVFDFLSVKLIVPRINGEFSAWLYIPHYSIYRNLKNIHEIICEWIENLNDCENVKIRLNNHSIILPYDINKIYIV